MTPTTHILHCIPSSKLNIAYVFIQFLSPCCLLSIKVGAWKVFFFLSSLPGVTPERCSVAACLWYARPIYRLCRRAVASHHNSQPQDTSWLCCVPALLLSALQPFTETSTLQAGNVLDVHYFAHCCLTFIEKRKSLIFITKCVVHLFLFCGTSVLYGVV